MIMNKFLLRSRKHKVISNINWREELKWEERSTKDYKETLRGDGDHNIFIILMWWRFNWCVVVHACNSLARKRRWEDPKGSLDNHSDQSVSCRFTVSKTVSNEKGRDLCLLLTSLQTQARIFFSLLPYMRTQKFYAYWITLSMDQP